MEQDDTRRSTRLSIVVPCYNEQEVLGETASRLLALLTRLEAAGKVGAASTVWFVDDGSRDATWRLIGELCRADGRIRGVKLSRNRGHQNALMAGLFSADGDAMVSIDADLQDDVDAIEQMVDRFHAGDEVVLGVRESRDKDTFFKRSTAASFYRTMRWLGVETVSDHADFRLLSRRAVEALGQFREANLFLRGIVPLLGFRTALVYYARGERFAGESKYPLRKMLAFALEGITSFSVRPLRFITLIGFLVFLLTIALTAWVLFVRVFTHDAVPGWASTVLPLYFIGGVQILCLGVMGEYLGKIYTEVKARPRFIVDRIAGGQHDGRPDAALPGIRAR